MKKIFIVAIFIVVGTTGAFSATPPTSCPTDFISYQLTNGLILANNSCPTGYMDVGVVSTNGAIFAAANTPYTDGKGIYEYENYVCAYE